MKKLIQSLSVAAVLTVLFTTVITLDTKAAAIQSIAAEPVECSGSPNVCVEIEIAPGTRPIIFLKGGTNFQ